MVAVGGVGIAVGEPLGAGVGLGAAVGAGSAYTVIAAAAVRWLFGSVAVTVMPWVPAWAREVSRVAPVPIVVPLSFHTTSEAGSGCPSAKVAVPTSSKEEPAVTLLPSAGASIRTSGTGEKSESGPTLTVAVPEPLSMLRMR